MKPTIVSFVDTNYISVATVWLVAIRELGLQDQVCLVTLDSDANAAFGNITTLYRPLNVKKKGLKALWAHRIAVLSEFLATGIDVVHSDVDAIWIRNPLPEIKACASSAVFSQGTFWPRDVHEKNKVVVCCGLFYLAADAPVQAFLRAVNTSLKDTKDDQIAMNRVIANGINDWEISAPYKIPFRDTYFLASRQAMRATVFLEAENHLKVSILPHHAYPRIVDQIDDEVIVAHPLSGKTMPEKKACLSQLGLWRTP